MLGICLRILDRPLRQLYPELPALDRGQIYVERIDTVLIVIQFIIHFNIACETVSTTGSCIQPHVIHRLLIGPAVEVYSTFGAVIRVVQLLSRLHHVHRTFWQKDRLGWLGCRLREQFGNGSVHLLKGTVLVEVPRLAVLHPHARLPLVVRARKVLKHPAAVADYFPDVFEYAHILMSVLHARHRYGVRFGKHHVRVDGDVDARPLRGL